MANQLNTYEIDLGRKIEKVDADSFDYVVDGRLIFLASRQPVAMYASGHWVRVKLISPKDRSKDPVHTNSHDD